MARARRSLSPTASLVLVGKHETAPGFSDEKLECGPGADLEDGEITDEAKLEDAETTVMDGAGPTSSTETGTLSNGALEEPKPTAARLPDLAAAHPEQAPEQEQKNSSDSVVDANTPRALSPEEFDLAKNIVLDLLGWGVQPEYLIECGVSSHAIYRIFTDLRLRLPSNLSYFG